MEIVLGKLPDDRNNDRAREDLRRLETKRPDVHIREMWYPAILAEAFGFPFMKVNGTRYFGLDDIHEFVEHELANQ